MASAAARERYARKNEQDELERAFRTIDKKGDDKIDAEGVKKLQRAHIGCNGGLELGS